ncbi:MAG TPA: pyruvate dehydrogenase (acetyl-transferring), homodimeric type [Solirubrobacteraceae bacterium]|jgi:pyruvate dehydrogenase E1 component|nr:pyruvate dehydrogenase (acetyl-transferring), homodimeric type [Solirubrobacteraceae bacterium]
MTTTTFEDVDPQETAEWLEALEAVVAADGPQRAQDLLQRVIAGAARRGVSMTAGLSTPYVNTLPPAADDAVDAEEELERRIRAYVRWNAIAMVLRANAESSELGGHIASYQSAATLYEVGFNHFWRAPGADHGGDLVYIQGHSSPGIYARAFLEGRLSEEQLDGFRQEVSRDGIASYPHPWLMPDFWQFPTVSMGLGPLMAIHQAYFMKYLEGRGLADTAGRKVWAFLGDGEMDEPESTGALGLAGRERLDNLIFVVNCNLQRLDGPVRGNGKIIQELESAFRGSGWNVLKVVWGRRWDPLLEADRDGALVRRMEEALDGDYQTYKSRDGAYVREHFFGTDPELAAMVEDLSDEDIWNLNRGGHDPIKVHAAYKAAVEHEGQPTVILAKTIKGYGMGEAGEGQNITHQQKKMGEGALLSFRTRFGLPLSDEQAREKTLVRLPEGSPEEAHLKATREALGGHLPVRRPATEPLPAPELEAFRSVLDGSGEREVSTTMAFVRVLSSLIRDKQLGPRVVPIVADESRTFGMEGMFRQLGIFSQVGQLYQPEDAEQLMFYKEDRKGQILQEGINEAGALSSWLAAATSYANHGEPMIPFYVFYSMFGFQRVGDLAWAAGDNRARGFLIGGTAGRTTLNGEGLQHEDGHSHLLAATYPTCVAYDPAYGHEVAVIVQDGLRRMLAEQEDVFFYLTVMNENYPQPPLSDGAEEGIVRGIHPIRSSDTGAARVRLLGSGTILREVLAGADLLAEDWGVPADVWSVTSFTELHRDGIAVDRWNRLHPTEEPRTAYVAEALGATGTPVVAATDYQRAVPELVRSWVDGHYEVLGTDGFGRSDYRRALRRFFEVDRHHVAVAALHALAQDGEVEPAVVREAIERYDIDAEVDAPWRR